MFIVSFIIVLNDRKLGGWVDSRLKYPKCREYPAAYATPWQAQSNQDLKMTKKSVRWLESNEYGRWQAVSLHMVETQMLNISFTGRKGSSHIL